MKSFSPVNESAPAGTDVRAALVYGGDLAIAVPASRTVVFVLPLVGLQGLWMAFPIADTLATVITVGWMALFIRKRLPAPHGEPNGTR